MTLCTLLTLYFFVHRLVSNDTTNCLVNGYHGCDCRSLYEEVCKFINTYPYLWTKILYDLILKLRILTIE